MRNLVDIASKGGNFLLNVGPTGEGLIPAPSVERLAEVGRWMKVNGEAIYGSDRLPAGQARLGPLHRKPSRPTAPPALPARLRLARRRPTGAAAPARGARVVSARLLAGGQRLGVEQKDGKVAITVPVGGARPDLVDHRAAAAPRLPDPTPAANIAAVTPPLRAPGSMFPWTTPRDPMRLLPRETSYFDQFEQQGRKTVEGCQALLALMERLDEAPARAKDIKRIEEECDSITHAVVASLHKTFITPLDRNDIHG